jgi:uncharacterized alkaline shock family protein YloU
MSRDGQRIESASGTIRVEPDALARLVSAAAERVDGARVRRPRRGLDVAVSDGRVRVELELAARYGASLPALARGVQEQVAEALGAATSLAVEAVDVSIEELDA